MNVAQPEGQEEEEEDGDEGEDDDMEPPPPPPPDEALAAERRMEVASAPALVGCLLEGTEKDATGSCGHCGREQNLSPELQQAYRILSEFLLEKHRPLTTPFLRPAEGQRIEDGLCEGASSSSQNNTGQPPTEEPQQLTLLKMEEKFSAGQYSGIADFVADFRLMLETCYRLHGVDHWLSKQAQKLEMMLEQKLALLSRHLREKTAIAVTSKGFYGLEDEKGAACASTRRRSTPRSLAGLTTGVFESVMVQVLRQEEQQRAKEEKRHREQERKEAEEASHKEIEEWDKSLLSQAAPSRMEHMWEIPAIGHFLCLAQHILNLPEIVFYELERCLLMPQCSGFLSKIMTSLLSPPHRRSTLHRRPTLPYRTWEAALRQKIQHWYTSVGQTDNPDSSAEKLGLCPQFFQVLGEVNPLEEKAFHELSFYKKVWLLKGLCDFVYETQKDVQDAVLGQPIHECREVILGYDYLENAYVHFPQFCGADVRIYKQRPFHAPEFPAPPIKVKRIPRIKLEKVKTEYATKSNGEVRCGAKEEVLSHAKTEHAKDLCSAKIHLDRLSVAPGKEIKSKCEEKIHKGCDFTTDCCKENRDKSVVLGENAGFGGPLSPGEIRIVENGGKCGESSLVKNEATPLKENTLKTCQMHVNGNHNDNPDMNCHKVAPEVSSVENSKTLKLSKMRAKKKKKKKKKLKDILSEKLQRKREIHLHSLKSYKPEIQNKLLMMKKKVKHKKHKSGKKSISKKAITKKRKSVMKPAVPEFQLICTNLDELRDLIRKIENELRDVENIKKKSGRWYHRKQAVKELHCTLIRLLNELLPWEPKLMKAFQRNRSRLKKDYDDFRRQPDYDKFTREQWTNEDSEVNAGKEISSILTSESSEHSEFPKRDYTDADMKLSETDLAVGKTRPLKKELSCKEIQKTLPKSVKRHSKQNSYLDDSTKEFLPRKKLKLSTSNIAVHGIENELSLDGSLNKQKQTESPFSELLDMTDSTASTSSITKGTKPIQALLAKNTGNKVTLTSQLVPSAGRSIAASEKLIMSTVGSSPVSPVLSCQTNSKSPLQVLYKMPGGHCVPIDLHNNSMKIQVQPVVDYKQGDKATGEKLMQQVLILPKNFLIHHRETKNVGKDILSLQHKTTDQQCTSLPQPVAVHTTLATSLSASTVNAAATFLTIPDFKKNATHLSPGPSIVKRLPVLPSITSTGSVLTSVAKMSESETIKTKTVVSAASFSVTSPTVSSTIQPLTPPLPQNISAGTNSSSPRLASPQKSNDTGEAKQELKTVCIRDSQSILVRTRGGNTGIVKVQTSADHCSTSNLSPGSVFTYAPQLQAFLVPKTTQLTTSTFSASTTTIPNFPALAQSSLTTSASTATLPSGISHVFGENMPCAFGQSHNSGTVGHGMQKAMHVSSPTFLPPASSSNIVMPTLPNSSGNAVGIPPGNNGPSTSGVTQTPFINQQVDGNNMQHLVTQPETSATSSGNLMCGAQIPKLMLVTNPPLLSSCGTTGVNLIPPPTSTGLSAQKLVFINTPLANIQSTSNLTAESFKQTFPPNISKTYVKSTEQPQLVLIPSTMGASLKVNASPTVSQIKDVKIGVNIGQAIINSTCNAQNVPPVSAAPKEVEEKNSQSVILPMSTSGGLLPLSSALVSQSITPVSESPVVAAQALNMSTAASACLDSASVARSGASTGTLPTVLVGGIDTSTKLTPLSATRLRTSNAGNTVAISTVKTGHLASSVLISSTQPTVSHPSISTFHLPVTVALPGPVNGAPKMIHTVPQLPAGHCIPLSKRQQSALVHFQSPGISATVPTNGSAQKPQTVLPPNLPNAGKVISLSNLVPLSCPQLSPNFIKPAPALSCTPVASTTHTVPVSSVAAGQLNESCVQQKIIINTCTPLAPGTQIMISGTRFIVPPQGLGAGSHVLLISANPKLGPLLTVSNGHGFQGVPHAPPGPQKITQVSDNTLSWQPLKQPLKSTTKIVNSLGAANILPIVHATPQIVNSAAKPCTPPSAAALSPSLVTASSSSAMSKTSLVSACLTDNSPVQDRASVLHLDTSLRKLMVSPEGAILNAINTPNSKTSSLPSSFSPDPVSTTRNPAVIFPTFLKSSIGVPDTAAS
ncbi:putative bromodomain-containing protein 10 isoform X2 [Paroedura picta]|uniref:putative bromodomain-containing protein 10 isoform X2 n=1 Tax=Paroedura picta TaxID=143630 RepID=UPI0040567150